MDAWRLTRVSAAAAASLAVAACSAQPRLAANAVMPVSFTAADRECMARAMYFESHRGADEGMVAVGTVVANRKASGRYGATICEVVGQKRQFAAGVMVRSMEGEAAERARRNAEKVLAGHRHPALKSAMFFHTAGYKFRYPNMHYVLVAGGNAFYEKREAATAADARENAKSKALALAYARIDPTGAAKPIVVASLDRGPAEPARVASPAAEPRAVAAAPAPAPRIELARTAPAEAPSVPHKRVLEPAGLAPVFASSTPSAPASSAPVAERRAESATRGPSYNGEVAAAFSAFETR